MRVAGGYRIHPESLAKLLEVFRGGQELQSGDLEQRSIGGNLIVSRFDDILEKVEHALVLLDKTADSAEHMMSVRYAAILVEHYGEHSFEMLGEITENVATVAELLGIKTTDERKIIGVAIKVLVEEVIGRSCQGLLPLTVEEMFGGVGLRTNE